MKSLKKDYASKLIDGQQASIKMLDDLKAEILKQPIVNPPTLTIVLVGDRPDSLIYVKSKLAACDKIGVKANF